MKILKYMMTTAALFFLLPVSQVFSEPIRIVATTSLAGSLAETIGGDQVVVHSMAKAAQDPHFVNPRPSYCIEINQADLLIVIGQGLEDLWLPELLSLCRNSRIQEGSARYLDLSKGVRLLPLPEIEEEPRGWFASLFGRLLARPDQYGQVPGVSFMNHHYWLDPANGKIMAQSLSSKLAVMDPVHAGQYRDNYQKFGARIDERLDEWEGQMKPIQGLTIAAYGMAWAYLAERHGLKLIGYAEPVEGRSPNPKQRTSFVELMEASDARILLMENHQNQNIATRIAKEANAEVIALPTSVNPGSGPKNYIEMLEMIYERIEGGLKGSKSKQ